ncbi:hypothetical protein EVAR_87622_1 [Eumeta japonica]|uniref:Mos1 transposase HTH domain-containing protein n=1 Tax=Eumeta variegata TaxID=151549 RepID=A0A4C1WLP4_EUMVA|nr:hypothetical protein EVAR_87622_1 [Eumeta japonica]
MDKPPTRKGRTRLPGQCNLTAQQSLARLRISFGDEAPCKTAIYNWLPEFERGRVNLSDEFRDGRPSTAVNNKNIDAVRQIFSAPYVFGTESESGSKEGKHRVTPRSADTRDERIHSMSTRAGPVEKS